MKERNNNRSCPSARDLIDRIHARMINFNQYSVEHEALDYWLRDSPAQYNPLLQRYYLEPGNSFFREAAYGEDLLHQQLPAGSC